MDPKRTAVLLRMQVCKPYVQESDPKCVALLVYKLYVQVMDSQSPALLVKAQIYKPCVQAID